MNSKVVIVGAKRTPIGSFQGQFSTVSSDELGAAAIAGARPCSPSAGRTET